MEDGIAYIIMRLEAEGDKSWPHEVWLSESKAENRVEELVEEESDENITYEVEQVELKGAEDLEDLDP